MTISRSDARSLSSTATRVGATVLGGRLTLEDEYFVINKTDVTELLENLVGRNVILVVTSVDDPQKERTRTCLTCGREYTGSECSHCARVRSRLRGNH
ncbi:MAG TPA: hypothetical protein G4N96_04090 [Chloroflexi bacterium]|nr:hypothetical protein [Chloroflexota bacterium]